MRRPSIRRRPYLRAKHCGRRGRSRASDRACASEMVQLLVPPGAADSASPMALDRAAMERRKGSSASSSAPYNRTSSARRRHGRRDEQGRAGTATAARRSRIRKSLRSKARGPSGRGAGKLGLARRRAGPLPLRDFLRQLGNERHGVIGQRSPRTRPILAASCALSRSLGVTAAAAAAGKEASLGRRASADKIHKASIARRTARTVTPTRNPVRDLAFR